MKIFTWNSMLAVSVTAVLAGCGGGGSGTSASPVVGGDIPPGAGATAAPAASPSGAPPSPGTPAATPPAAAAQLRLPAGLTASIVANVNGARELAALPDGDLLVGTSGSTIVIIPSAEAAGIAGPPVTFASLPDDKASSVALSSDGNIYVGTDHGIWRIGYTPGATSGGAVARIANVRSGAVAPNTDGDNHSTTSVAVSGSVLYAGVGSDCDACAEADPTRASVQQMALDGSAMTTKAKNYRNPLALATDPSTGALWAGGAGQDSLPFGHPYEALDALTSHAGTIDYGWPACYDNRLRVAGSAPGTCDNVTLPALVFPAYATLIGATFYPIAGSGSYAFAATYRGGLFVTMHGSWHTAAGGVSAVQPQVAFVPFASGMPRSAVNWNDPTAQWQPFFENFGATASTRIGRPTGIAVGSQGSLFVADDLAGNIYRIRPVGATSQSLRRR